MRSSTPRSVHRRGFTVRLLRLRDLTPKDFAAWRALEGSAIEPYPQLSATYLKTALRERTDCDDIHLLIASDDHGWAFLSPVTAGRLAPRVPIKTASIANEFMESESSRRYPLLDSERGAEALSAVLRSLRTLRLPPFLIFTAVDEVDVLIETIERGATIARGRTMSRHRYHRAVLYPEGTRAPLEGARASWDADFIPHDRSADSRRKAGRLARRLKEALAGEDPLLTMRTDAGMIDDFLELQSKGWKGDDTRGGEGYAALGHVDWYRAFTAAYHETGQLVGFEVTSGTRRLYMTICLRVGHTLFGLQDAYDEDFGAFDAGRLARQAVINLLRDRNIDLFDPNIAWYIAEAARTYPHRRGQREMILTSASLYGQAVMLAWEAVKRLKRATDSVRAEDT